MDLTSAFSVSWPVLLVCAVAIAAVGWTMKTSAAALRRSLEQLASAQTKLSAKIDATDRQFGEIGTRQTQLMDRLAGCERALQQRAPAMASTAPARAVDNADRILDLPAESVQRFEAASQALAQFAQELGGLDARQIESWQRIEGDLQEQSFHLQRVQQHVDRLFAGVVPEKSNARASVSTA